GNVFLGGDIQKAYGYDTAQGIHPPAGYGTAAYDGSPTSLEDFIDRMANLPEGSYSRIPAVKEPAYLRDNVYAPGASAFADESSALALTGKLSFEVVEEGDGTPAVVDVDLLGERKEQGQDYPAGPIATLSPGTSRIRVW